MGLDGVSEEAGCGGHIHLTLEMRAFFHYFRLCKPWGYSGVSLSKLLVASGWIQQLAVPSCH